MPHVKVKTSAQVKRQNASKKHSSVAYSHDIEYLQNPKQGVHIMRTEQTRRGGMPLSSIIMLVGIAGSIGVGVPMLTYNNQSDTIVYLALFSVIIVSIFASLFMMDDKTAH